MSIPVRPRRLPEAVRADALAQARGLLLAGGPDAVTLKAVSTALGMTHANLIHHFGSAAAMQAALAEMMVDGIRGRVRDATADLRAGRIEPRALVDLVFDNFESEGIGRLVAWMILSGEEARLMPMLHGIRELVEAIVGDAGDAGPVARAHVTASTLILVLSALGGALAGPQLHAALGREPGAARDALADFLAEILSRRHDV